MELCPFDVGSCPADEGLCLTDSCAVCARFLWGYALLMCNFTRTIAVVPSWQGGVLLLVLQEQNQGAAAAAAAADQGETDVG